MIERVGMEAAAELAALHASAFAKAWSASEMEVMLNNPAVIALAVRPVPATGFALAWVAAGDAEVLTLAVHPDARRAGLGGRLLEATLQHALARGARSIHLEVAEDNRAARALYAKWGFNEAGRRIGYYAREHVAVDAIVMRLGLAPDEP